MVRDEGEKLFDWNSDGRLDILLLDPSSGLVLWERTDDGFTRRLLDLRDVNFSKSWGLWTDDFDGDGFDDIVIDGTGEAG